jgi:hypothetical protein
MNYEGKVIKIMEAERKSEKFVKRNFIVSDTREKYQQQLIFETQNSNCSLVDGIKVGDEVDVHFHIRGREWTSPQGVVKYFLTLVATEILKTKSSDSENKKDQEPVEVPETQNEVFVPTPNDDLPF